LAGLRVWVVARQPYALDQLPEPRAPTDRIIPRIGNVIVVRPQLPGVRCTLERRQGAGRVAEPQAGERELRLDTPCVRPLFESAKRLTSTLDISRLRQYVAVARTNGK